MLLTLVLVLVLVAGGLLVWKARQEDGTFNWKLGAAGLLGIGIALWEAVANGLTGLFN